MLSICSSPMGEAKLFSEVGRFLYWRVMIQAIQAARKCNELMSFTPGSLNAQRGTKS